MNTNLAHLQVNIQASNLAFYKDLLLFLGWNVVYETEAMVGLGDAKGTSVWFIGGAKSVANDYDGPGVNHLAIGASSIADVDAAAGYLREHDVPALFETPRHRPDFAGAEDQTYYQVMFESPDRILFEVVYTGPKPA